MLELIVEAQASGARLVPTCRLLGISARTIERWRAEPEVGDRRCGPRRRPANALSSAEEAQVVTVLTSSRYAALSPKQLVPQLADEGLYLASESTMYRVQRRHGAENLALVRRMALRLLKRHPGTESVACKRLAAALDTAFLEEILHAGSNLGNG